MAASLLLPHQQRVIKEKKELDTKIAALSAFIGSEVFMGLNPDERFRLVRQRNHMLNYSDVLNERINAWREAA